jgi:hypothetical protein
MMSLSPKYSSSAYPRPQATPLGPLFFISFPRYTLHPASTAATTDAFAGEIEVYRPTLNGLLKARTGACQASWSLR